jgi:MFS family permease
LLTTSPQYANLLGVKTDLHLTGKQYSFLGSAFYLGWLGASPLHGYMLQRFNISRYVGVVILLWATCLGLHAAAYNYAGLVACRIFLGILEGGLTPAFILVTGRFYTRKEQVIRTSWWFSANATAQILGGGIAYGLLSQPAGPLQTWRTMFIILGAITAFYAFPVFFFMPCGPEEHCRFFSKRERLVAIERVRENKTGLHDKTFKWDQLREALCDPRLYLFFCGVAAANVANGGVSNFGSAIISGLGYNKKDTALLGMAPGFAEGVFIAAGAWLANRTGSRAIPGCAAFLVALVGGALMISPSLTSAVKFLGYTIVFAYPVASPVSAFLCDSPPELRTDLLIPQFYYSWLSSCIGGTTKRIVFNAALQLGYSAGNIVGPQLYRQQDAPNYLPAKIAMEAMFGISASCLVAIALIHRYWNHKRDAAGEVEEHNALEGLEDRTDKDLQSFRYPY